MSHPSLKDPDPTRATLDSRDGFTNCLFSMLGSYLVKRYHKWFNKICHTQSQKGKTTQNNNNYFELMNVCKIMLEDFNVNFMTSRPELKQEN
jgi:hypothetical protein